MEGVERWKVEDSNLKNQPVLCSPGWTWVDFLVLAPKLKSLKSPLMKIINLGRIYQNPGSSSYDSGASRLCARAAVDSNLKRQLFVCGSLDTSQVLVATQANPPLLVLSTTLDKLHLELPFLLQMQH